MEEKWWKGMSMDGFFEFHNENEMCVETSFLSTCFLLVPILEKNNNYLHLHIPSRHVKVRQPIKQLYLKWKIN